MSQSRGENEKLKGTFTGSICAVLVLLNVGKSPEKRSSLFSQTFSSPGFVNHHRSVFTVRALSRVCKSPHFHVMIGAVFLRQCNCFKQIIPSPTIDRNLVRMTIVLGFRNSGDVCVIAFSKFSGRLLTGDLLLSPITSKMRNNEKLLLNLQPSKPKNGSFRAIKTSFSRPGLGGGTFPVSKMGILLCGFFGAWRRLDLEEFFDRFCGFLAPTKVCVFSCKPALFFMISIGAMHTLFLVGGTAIKRLWWRRLRDNPRQSPRFGSCLLFCQIGFCRLKTDLLPQFVSDFVMLSPFFIRPPPLPLYKAIKIENASSIIWGVGFWCG